ncbi:DUF998 domain-containing protein [Amycolatopsis sp. OK19-0408]|uniref:DUF998 domain-containing protein n=1 Tax=Amycolatopsis iheyensis TaxID=2945988 RepID=A0A9X2NK00_9PSEU|nr:DUF998 domain-containing protein [Amycolatopsis iheyensis]MCR6489177.1 DUF998 domain-containing protein [Amycolatopsis iheyensis]
MTPRTARFATLTLVMAAVAQAIIAGLSFGLAGHVSPWRDPVSDYAWHRGGRLLFTVAILLLLVAAAALAVAAQLAALPHGPLVSTLFLLWAAGLVVVLCFRSNFSAADPTVSGEIHRFGGAVLFASLPLAAWTLSARLRAEPRWRAAAPALRRGAIAGVVTAAAFGAAQVVGWLPAGLLERFALLAEFLIVATMALALRRAARASLLAPSEAAR